MRRVILLPILFVLSAVYPIFAQNACPAWVEQAMSQVGDICASTGRNQLCYGNDTIDAVTYPSISDFDFAQPGDIADVTAVQSLRLGSMDIASGTWGMALLRIQADLPDTLPGQNVVFVLFGDVEIMDVRASEVLPKTIEITANSGVNIRSEPSTESSIVGGLQTGQILVANGRNDDGSWLRVQLDDSAGWVFAQLFTVKTDVTDLAIVDSSSITPEFGPMQAFTFRSSIGDSKCIEAPESGILIQTPRGAATVHLSVNGVSIQLGSTIFIQAEASADMIVRTFEGAAQIEAEGVARTVETGMQVRIPMDERLRPAGVPSELETVESDSMGTTLLGILPEQVVTTPNETVAVTPEATDDDLPNNSGGGTYQVTVPSNSDWVNSGVMVTSSQTLNFSASGLINVWPNCETEKTTLLNPPNPDLDCSLFIVDPNGWILLPSGRVAPACGEECGAPELRPHALVGRIGASGTPFLIGESLTLTADSSGELQLRLNDSDFNNSGEFIVVITVE